jgi:hypothetical protein
VEEALNHSWFRRFGLLGESDAASNSLPVTTTANNVSVEVKIEETVVFETTKNAPTVAAELGDQSINGQLNNEDESSSSNNTVLVVESTTAMVTTEATATASKLETIKDDKNNNSLTSLTEVDIKSSSLSSISSTCSAENVKIMSADEVVLIVDENELQQQQQLGVNTSKLTSEFSEFCIETSAVINSSGSSSSSNSSDSSAPAQTKSIVNMSMSDFKSSMHHSHFSTHFSDQFNQLNGNMEQHRAAVVTSSLATTSSVMVTASNQIAQ